MDRHLRDAERHNAEHRNATEGAVEAESALLLEQVRVGALAPLRLEAAACLGHPAACLALGGPPAGETDAWIAHWWDGPGRIPRWSVVLDEVGAAAQTRVGIAVVRAHMPYGHCGVRRAARFLLEDEERVVAADKTKDDALSSKHTGIDRMLSILRPSSVIDPGLVHSCHWRLGHSWLPAEDLRRAIHDDLVPWLLGRGDPVAERVAARPDPTPPVTVVRYV